MEKETTDALQKVLTYIATAGLGAFTGAIQYLQQFRVAGPQWSWKVFSIQLVTSALAGKIADWLFTGWKSDHNLVIAAVALAGWGGAQAIGLAGRKIGTAREGADTDATN